MVAIGAVGAALFFGLGGLGGCGGANEAGSARERDEPRPYGRILVRSEVTPRHVTLGDPVVWTLTATVPRTCLPEPLRLDPAPSSLELVPRGEPNIRPGRDSYVWSRRYDLRGFDLGAIPLPAAALGLRVRTAGGAAFADTILFPPDTLAVDSLTESARGALSPDRGPLDPGLRPVDLGVAAALALLVVGVLVALLVAWRRRRARPIAAKGIPVEPPEAAFERALESLRREGATLARGAFHDRLSEAIREYVGAATGVDALDLTTRELEREMKRSSRTRPEAAAEVVRILRRSDLVKFAKRADAWDEAKGLLDDAGRLAGAVAAAPAAEPPPRKGA
jgi:hypothetical protein